MRTTEAWLLAYLLNSLWQVPMVFAAAWLLSRLVRRSGSALQHRVWVGALVLEALLPACNLSQGRLFSALAQLFPWRSVSTSAHADIHITILSGAAFAHGGFRLPAHLLAFLTIAYACSLAYFILRLLSRFHKTRVLHREARRIAFTGAAAATWNRCCRIFAVHNAEAAVSNAIPCPATIGIRRRTLLLPAHFCESLQAEDIDAAIAHEFAHMQRRDFAKNLFYTALALPIGWHPLLWLTRARLEESREMVCDAMAADALAGSHTYAGSLLRLASLFLQDAPDKTSHAIGIFDANTFERRIMNLTQTPIELRGARRLATAAACIVLGLGTCASALALRMNVAVPSTTSSQKVDKATRPNVVFSKEPKYPPQGKKDKVSGTVMVALIVTKDGLPTHVVVKKSLRADFDRNAIEAVKQYRFKPALLDGHPVKSSIYISVNYQIF